MKLSVSAYRAHASAHKKILDQHHQHQLNYGSTLVSHLHHPASTSTGQPTCSGYQINLPSGTISRGVGTGEDVVRLTTDYQQPSLHHNPLHPHNHQNPRDGTYNTQGANNRLIRSSGNGGGDVSSEDIHTPRSQNTSREEDDSSNANESDYKTNNQRTKSNQRWMKLRTTVQISSAISAKKPPLKREDSFLQRFSTRQIPEAQETVEDTGSECGAADDHDNLRRRRKRRQPKTVVNPDSNFYFYWLLILTVCVLYNMWTLIVRESFPELQDMISTFWLSCDLASDVVFVLDLAVQLRTGYLEQGLMVFDSRKLACHYLKSRAFLLDLAALCPLEMLQFRLGWHPLLRFPRFLKVYRAVNYYYMVESRTVWPNLWRVVNLIHILLILAHWFGCFYFLLSEAEGFQGEWVYPYRPGDYATLSRKYLGSLYWSTLTLTTIGDLPTPETNAEDIQSVDGPRSLARRGIKSRLLQFNTNHGYVFTIVSYLIGVFIFATIVGQVGNVITNRNANRLEFERLLDGAKTYMRHHKVPGGMKRRVLRWYDYSWSRGRIQGGGDINTALGLLPDKLKTELALHVNLSVLKKVTIFQECQPEFLRDLVLKMKAYIFTPGDSICRKGEVAREMFIIADGILEVLSEHGKVLTTMKAGDFFGEIGILNLDGLNKRTADVRSVGYSELFSLSREDVLAAMKDYPEAQEILQALGRKRLMEVKASARLPPHKEHHHHVHQHLHDGIGLVDKIRSEAKGLRNVLKKTKTHRRSEEPLELEPLYKTSTSREGKGTLKRMSRVKSNDNSEDNGSGRNNGESNQPVTSPIGAGLPLLQRLKLLKEKQDREERMKSASPPMMVSPTSAVVRSPPPISERTTLPSSDPPDASAGLPLLQRILLLKEKEKAIGMEQPRTGVGGLGGGAQGITEQIFSGVTLGKGSASTQQSSVALNATHPANIFSKGEAEGGTIGGEGRVLKNLSIVSSKVAVPSKLVNKISLRDRIKLATSAKEKNSTIKNSLLKVTEPRSESALVRLIQPSEHKKQQFAISSSTGSNTHVSESKLSVESSTESSFVEPHWLKLKRAAISKDMEALVPSQEGDGGSAGEKIGNHEEHHGRGEEQGDVSAITPVMDSVKGKPNLKLSRKATKHYRSIDDLSPEYAPLPFVKKLKILNERQKLEELETVMKSRSFSLDIPETQVGDSDTLTRLMRAPTIEGYAARHSKLSKSVTFNRDTLQSPPNGTSGDSQNLFPFAPPTTCTTTDPTPSDNVINEGRQMAVAAEATHLVPGNKGNNQHKSLKGSLDDEQQYFTDIIFGIKQVMSSHLQDIQDKYQRKFEKLQEEMRYKDELISQLKGHILKLEKTSENPFTTTDPLDTDANREVDYWEDPTHDAGEDEMQDLPCPLPDSTSPPQNIVLHIDSTTESESDVCETSEGDAQSDECESGNEYENSSSNWEIELLAAQMRERRSASLDLQRPLTKTVTKGSSVDLHE
ncbi:unnamed protein product [Callosobruchus maculatus]|uniref:Cyclic nucleotide-binding domain-containing protein n=1 Tax=Callosobruchus maculatus TaxID=64391 RepID=A0A653CW83_CALMS|nr:unnamed protein product [Callosobruchus maculatus]